MARWQRSDRRSTLQYVIRLARVTGSMTKVHYQVSQSNWLNGRGLANELSKIPDKKSAKVHLQKCHQVSQSNRLDDEGKPLGLARV